jgi:hypothetical protein
MRRHAVAGGSRRRCRRRPVTGLDNPRRETPAACYRHRIEEQDEVATGVNARLLLRLGDGSMVKLGENGQLQISGLLQRRQQNFVSDA